jgi:hypothetical protein
MFDGLKGVSKKRLIIGILAVLMMIASAVFVIVYAASGAG